MAQKNIIYIFGTDSYRTEYDKNTLIRVFIEKYGEENIEFCSLNSLENYKKYQENILSVSLFSEKRMFIFYGGKDKKPTKKDLQNTHTDFSAFLEQLHGKISDNDFLLFYQIGNGEENLKKWLSKNASLREHVFSWKISEWQKTTKLSFEVLKNILNYYQNTEKFREKGNENPFLAHNIMHTIKNIEILEQKKISITTEVIEQFSETYEGAKIFDFVDAILSQEIHKAFNIFDKIKTTLDSRNIELFMGSFIGILKKNLYILHLKKLNKTPKEILELLPGINSFMMQKCLQSTIPLSDFSIFFQKIITINIASKSGKLVGKNILGRFFEIDTALLGLKK